MKANFINSDLIKKVNLRTKLTGLFIILVVITMSSAGYISYSTRIDQLQESYLKSISAMAELKAEMISDFIQSAITEVNYLSEITGSQLSSAMADTATVAVEESFDMLDDIQTPLLSNDQLLESLNEIVRTTEAVNIMITDTEGRIEIQTNHASHYDNIRQIIEGYDEQIVPQTKNGIFISRIFRENDDFRMIIGAPVKVAGRDVTQLCFIKKSMAPIYKVLGIDLEGTQTVETVLAAKIGNRAVILNPLKFDPEAALERGVFMEEARGKALQESVTGVSGSGFSMDYRNEETLAAWRTIPSSGWGLVVKIDMSEVLKDSDGIIYQLGIYGVVILVFTILLGLLFSQYFINPLLSLRNSMQSLSLGVLPDEIEKKFNDEIGDMANTANNLVQSLKRTATFAEKIGKGDFKADYQPLSEGDILGNALLNMRKNLLENERKDTQRNWIVTGVAEISEILRSHDTIDTLGDAVISYITDKIEAIQGAFYVVNDENRDDPFIELKSTYAYHKKKYLDGRFRFAEGLVGQAAAEQDSILRTEIPFDYISITSGILGDQRPGCILITPLKAEDKVYGVLEFAGFSKFSEGQIKFVEEISLILARTIFNIKVNERTRNLLEESQKMSNELQEQQEILRQNAEEMAATQEELKRTNQRLEDQIQEVNNTRNRMQLLLENASEVIAIYEENGIIRYISPSVENILGYTQKDLIGINDKIYVHADGKGQFEEMFKAVIENPFDTFTTQYEYVKHNGESIWLEATATNLLADTAIQGIIINSRDITERRRAEREERMRSKMQALSENSPDLITRLNQQGEFFYINPMIEHYTGMKPDDFLNRQITEVALDDTVKEGWTSILTEVEKENEKIERELIFPSNIGERVMQVNAIPEFDDEKHMESVLMVSHDITERKQIELEIQSKNRKITESINYAKRIQGAILPNNSVIRQILPDSFILYKARDVVSGDFPWFVTVHDNIYFAAVDCTGHGVPGALISLIGYFLLNDIVKGRKISDPGHILDALDKSVTRTLRQEGINASTKDGMDIALAKINLERNEVTYAGAHRPLYHIHKGELQEYKGDKFPIGGGIYKNQTKFTSHKITVSKNDSIFFCSDGFPDQFGGPDNRKFGPRQLRELLIKHNKKSMKEMYHLLDESWKTWRGEQKQTDDVLMIGVRF